MFAMFALVVMTPNAFNNYLRSPFEIRELCCYNAFFMLVVLNQFEVLSIEGSVLKFVNLARIGVKISYLGARVLSLYTTMIHNLVWHLRASNFSIISWCATTSIHTTNEEKINLLECQSTK